MPQFPHFESYILVGGKSSRMGRDKVLLEIAGKPLLLRTLELVTPLVAGIALVGDPQLYGNFGYPILADKWPNAGPLGAIATALESARQPWTIILACDLPYLTGDWLAWLLDRTTKSTAGKTAGESVDIFIPETAQGLEPLCAVYRTSCATAIARALDRGVRKVTHAFAGLKVEYISESEWRPFSPDGHLFRNMNSPEDYQEARAHFED
jgi:molybdenum cofactor guanylyltransferase